MKQLTESIHNLIHEAGGTWGIAIEDLDTQETYMWNAEELFTAASVIKVPIMIAAFTAFQDRKFTFSDTLELKKEDQVGGSGVLQHMSPGTKLTIYDVLTLMIIQSDNTATNRLIDLLGTEYIQQVMTDIGLHKSTFHNKLMIVPANRKGPNQVTAAEMTSMLKKMVTGKLVSENACNRMIAILKKQQIRDCLPAKLPEQDSEIIGMQPEWTLANKTGTVNRVRHDIGVFYVGKRTLIASVLSKELEDFTSQQVFMDIGLEIYSYLKNDNAFL